MLSPAWLSHHREDHAERCLRVGGWHLCRRCLALWPACFAVLVAGVVHGWDVAGVGELAGWLVLPMAEYAWVHAGAGNYAAWRVWPLGALLGAGLGRAFHRYVLEPADPVAWGALIAVGLVGGLSLLIGRE